MKLKNFILLIAGIFFNVRIDLIGSLYLGELMFLLVLIFNFKLIGQYLKDIKPLKIFFSLLLIGVFMLIITNIINGVDFNAFAKGMANQVFLITTIFGAIVLFKNNLIGVAYFFLGKAIGNNFFQTYVKDFDNLTLESNNFFDISVAPVVTPLLIFLSIAFYRKKIFVLAIFILYGGFAILNEARSVGFVFILSSVLYTVTLIRVKINKWKIAIMAGIGIPFVLALYFFLGSRGHLGQTTYWQLNSSKEFSIFSLVNRSETLVGLIAFKDKFLLGHGSKTSDDKYYKIAKELNLIESFVKERERIPAHSVIVGMGVEAGILAALPWVYMLFLLYSLFPLIMNNKSKYTIATLYFLLISIWSILFSPFGFARLHFAVFFAFMVIYLLDANPYTIVQVKNRRTALKTAF